MKQKLVVKVSDLGITGFEAYNNILSDKVCASNLKI